MHTHTHQYQEKSVQKMLMKIYDNHDIQHKKDEHTHTHTQLR